MSQQNVIPERRPMLAYLGTASSVLVTLLALPCAAQTAPTEIVSLSAGGSPGGGNSHRPSISRDAHRIAFTSDAVLVPEDTNGHADIYVFDRAAGTTILVSWNGTTAANGDSSHARISANGEWIVFESDATNLLPGVSIPISTPPHTQVYRWRLSNHAIELVSVDASGSPGVESSWEPSISSDGSRVSFTSTANLTGVSPNPRYSQVYVQDISSATTYLVSQDSTGAPANRSCQTSCISGDGSFVAFHCDAANLVTPSVSPVRSQVVGRSLPAVLSAGTLELISKDASGQPGDNDSSAPSVSSTGGYIAFHSSAANLGATGSIDIFICDRSSGSMTRISSGSMASMWPSISGDGLSVAFHTATFAPGYPYIEVFRADSPWSAPPIQVSVSSNGTPGNAPSGFASIAGSTGCVTFESRATNLGTQSPGGFMQVYVHGDCAPPTGTVFCPGDGTGTACPCGNNSAVGAGVGCLHSFGMGGRLRAQGIQSITNDTVVLLGSQMTNASALYFQGSAQMNGGMGAVFGDGLRCAGGAVQRLAVHLNVGGASQYPEPGDLPISVRGGIVSPGTLVYQVWYRNSASFCTTAGFNLTNGFSIAWNL